MSAALPSAGRASAAGGGAVPVAGQIAPAAGGGAAGRMSPPVAGATPAARSGGRNVPVAGGGASGSSGSSAGSTAPVAGRSAGAAGGGSSMGEGRATMYVADGVLHDRCGEKVVLRGINHPTLYIDRNGTALPEIAKTGANSVRLFWFAS
ncbi:MAG TPA: hypothetical protein VJR89_42415, partial [Polyangiales bacterium]|nr:hypothetical protein [Polyangiales bacterium]